MTRLILGGLGDLGEREGAGDKGSVVGEGRRIGRTG